MKNITKIFALAVVVLGFSSTSFAQTPVGVTTTASTSATIITPIAITKTTDMNFGTIAVSASGGTVVLAVDNNRTTTGGVTLPNIAGTVTAAKFHVTGLEGSTYSISLPGAPITLVDGASHSMAVGTFVSTPTPTGLLGGSGQDINVGATISVAAGQTAGLYTNASDLAVTVNYN